MEHGRLPNHVEIERSICCVLTEVMEWCVWFNTSVILALRPRLFFANFLCVCMITIWGYISCKLSLAVIVNI
jgi:hypothetical protein